MKNRIMLGLVLLAITAAIAFSQGVQNNNQGLGFSGWSAWGGLRAAVQSNRVTLNGTVAVAGYVNTSMNPNMRNRTIRLEFQNVGASTFSEGRLMKIAINRNEEVLMPVNISGLINGEYIPSSYPWVEFVLPANFDGRLNFVFYQADLKDLRISATYR